MISNISEINMFNLMWQRLQKTTVNSTACTAEESYSCSNNCCSSTKLFNQTNISVPLYVEILKISNNRWRCAVHQLVSIGPFPVDNTDHNNSQKQTSKNCLQVTISQLLLFELFRSSLTSGQNFCSSLYTCRTGSAFNHSTRVCEFNTKIPFFFF